MPNQPSDLKSFLAMIEKGDYLVLDTETTGLKRPAEIVDIAVIDCNGRVLLDTLVKPVLAIPQEAMNIHGIDNDMVATARTWTELRSFIQEILSDKAVVTYNATFDRNMFHLSDEARGLKHYDWSGESRWFCAMLAFSERYGQYDDYFGNYRWKKLSEAHAFYNCHPIVAHRALGDCQMTLDVIKCMLAEQHANGNMQCVPSNGLPQ